MTQENETKDEFKNIVSQLRKIETNEFLKRISTVARDIDIILRKYKIFNVHSGLFMKYLVTGSITYKNTDNNRLLYASNYDLDSFRRLKDNHICFLTIKRYHNEIPKEYILVRYGNDCLTGYELKEILIKGDNIYIINSDGSSSNYAGSYRYHMDEFFKHREFHTIMEPLLVGFYDIRRGVLGPSVESGEKYFFNKEDIYDSVVENAEKRFDSGEAYIHGSYYKIRDTDTYVERVRRLGFYMIKQNNGLNALKELNDTLMFYFPNIGKLNRTNGLYGEYKTY